jgi:hypothetical protein
MEILFRTNKYPKMEIWLLFEKAYEKNDKWLKWLFWNEYLQQTHSFFFKNQAIYKYYKTTEAMKK